MTSSKMTLKQWYKGISVPNVSSSQYTQFISSCVGIVNKIVERELERKITVKFGDCPTAYADQAKAEIFISQKFAKGDFREASGGIFNTSEEIVPQILGIIVHEAAHFAYSPKDLKVFATKVEELLGEKVNKAVVMRLGNVVEDIFIEYEVSNRIPQITWMLDSLNDIMFNDEDYSKACSKISSQVAKPKTGDELASTVSFLIFAKTKSPVAINPYIDSLFKIAQSSREAKTVEERIAIVAELYTLVMPKVIEDDDGDDKALGDSKGSGGQGSSESSETGSGAAGEELDKEATDAMDSVSDGPTASLGKPSERTGDIVGYDIKSMNELIENDLEELQVDGDWKYADSYTMNRMTPTMHKNELEIDKRYAALAQVGRQAVTQNKPYGLDQRRGHSIRKLHRIATDGRIFAETVPSKTYKPMEVIILVDCSGSMSQHNNITKAGKAVIGAAAGLKEARCEVKIVGHTADFNSIDLTLYDIKDWNDPISVANKRMNTLASFSREFKLYQNRDHLAVKETAKDFRASNAQRRRLMIVISDGEPCANGNYFGTSAKEATRKVVNKVRKQGIDVISISITENAMSSNDLIYGKKYNVCNEDPNVIEEVISKLVRS